MRLVVLAAIAGFAVASLSVAGAAEAAGKRYELNIPRQTLDSALKEFARQTGLQVARFSDTVQGTDIVGPVAGALTAEQALTTLLAPSGLTYRLVNERTIAVLHPSELPAATHGASENGDSFQPGSASFDRTSSARASSRGVARKIRLAQADTTESPPSQTGTDSDSPAERSAGGIMGEVLVTGSHIRGEEVTSTPKRQYGRQEFEAAGAQTTEQFLRTLPLNFNGGRNLLGDRAANSFDNFVNNSRMTTANIRGLAAGSTLTLVNGRRMAPLSVGGNFDISVIPMSAVERIEIIPDGASAIYGSDAIAGVVNFILRSELDGAETTFQYGEANSSDYDETTASQVFGRSWQTGGTLLSYEYYDRGELRSDERDYSEPPSVPNATLVDPDRRDSVTASIHQRVGERVMLGLDALYSDRGGRTLQSYFVGLTQDFDVEYRTFAPSVQVTLSNDWSMELSGVFGGAREDIVAHFMGQDFGFSTDNTFTSADLGFTGTLFSLPAGGVAVALGGAYREEEEEYIQSGSSGRKRSRDISAGYLELLVPLASPAAPLGGIEQAQLSLAVRHEDYSDVGSSTDPRLGFSFSPVAGLNLRATYGTSFKAPTFSFSEVNEFLNIFDAPDPLSGQTVLLVFYGGTSPNIRPEEAESWTAGFDWTPPGVDGLTLNLTYYDVKFEGRIAGPGINYAEFLVDPDFFASFIDFDPTQDEIDGLLATVPDIMNSHGDFVADDVHALIDGRILNLATSKTSGLDLQVHYGFPALGGQLSLSLDATHVAKFDNQPLGSGPVSHDVDHLYRPLDWKARVGTQWSNQRLTLSAFLNYADSYRDTIAEPDAKVDAWTTFDLSVRYAFTAGALEGLSAFLNARNLFNEDPPRTVSSFNGNFYDGANADPFGRLLSAGFFYRW